MPHGAVDMGESCPPQSSQEAVAGTSTCGYQFVFFKFVSSFVLDFIRHLSGHQGESHILSNIHDFVRSWEGKRYFK